MHVSWMEEHVGMCVGWVYSLSVNVLSVNVCWVCLLYMHVEYVHVEFLCLSDASVEYACWGWVDYMYMSAECMYVSVLSVCWMYICMYICMNVYIYIYICLMGIHTECACIWMYMTSGYAYWLCVSIRYVLGIHILGVCLHTSLWWEWAQQRQTYGHYWGSLEVCAGLLLGTVLAG